MESARQITKAPRFSGRLSVLSAAFLCRSTILSIRTFFVPHKEHVVTIFACGFQCLESSFLLLSWLNIRTNFSDCKRKMN